MFSIRFWHTYIFYVYNIISPPFRSFQKYPCDVSISRKEYFKFKCVCLTDSVPLFFRRRNFVDKCAGLPPCHWGLFAQWHVFCTAALWLHIFKANTWKFQRHHRRQRAPASTQLPIVANLLILVSALYLFDDKLFCQGVFHQTLSASHSRNLLAFFFLLLVLSWSFILASFYWCLRFCGCHPFRIFFVFFALFFAYIVVCHKLLLTQHLLQKYLYLNGWRVVGSCPR